MRNPVAEHYALSRLEPYANPYMSLQSTGHSATAIILDSAELLHVYDDLRIIPSCFMRVKICGVGKGKPVPRVRDWEFAHEPPGIELRQSAAQQVRN